MIKGIIFDMDGTVIDSMNININNRHTYLNHLGITLKKEELDALDKVAWRETAAFINEIKGTDFCEKAFYDGIHETHYNAYRHVYEIIPGFMAFLDYLDEKGIKYALATATRLHGAEIVLDRFNLKSRFEFVLTEGRVGYTKDFPNIYLEAAKKMGTKIKETIVFEDALYALKTAKEAGFITVGLRDEYFIEDWDEMTKIADYMIDDYKDIIQIFEKLNHK